MKTLSLAFAICLALSSQSFAKTCYHLAELYTNAPTLPANIVPWEVCIDQVLTDAKTSTVQVVSSSHGSLFKNLKTERIVPRTATETAFAASSVFSQKQEPGCGRAEQARILVSGVSNASEAGVPSSLKVFVEHVSTKDSCLQPAWRKVYRYEAL